MSSQHKKTKIQDKGAGRTIPRLMTAVGMVLLMAAGISLVLRFSAVNSLIESVSVHDDTDPWFQDVWGTCGIDFILVTDSPIATSTLPFHPKTPFPLVNPASNWILRCCRSQNSVLRNSTRHSIHSPTCILCANQNC